MVLICYGLEVFLHGGMQSQVGRCPMVKLREVTHDLGLLLGRQKRGEQLRRGLETDRRVNGQNFRPGI